MKLVDFLEGCLVFCVTKGKLAIPIIACSKHRVVGKCNDCMIFAHCNVLHFVLNGHQILVKINIVVITVVTTILTIVARVLLSNIST